MFDSPTSLIFHAYTFNAQNNFGAVHWARGNAWGLIAAVELPDYLGLDATYPDAQSLVHKAQTAPDGLVRDVSAGTGVGQKAQHYYDIPKIQVIWGQSLAISAHSEALHLYTQVVAFEC